LRPGRVVVGVRGAEQVELGHLGDELGGEAAVPGPVLDLRQDAPVDPLPHRVADHPLFVGEQGVHLIEVEV
jgi:hypothetical protein